MFRKIEIINNYVPKAEGSCLVKMGKTQVLAGVKMEVSKPFPDTPEDGTMMINGELVPIAFTQFFAGPPSEDSIEMARVIDRGIRESKSLDTSKLCIVPGKWVWSVMVDIHVLDYDGNLFDAGNLAVINALWNTKIPKIEEVNANCDEPKIISGEHGDYLPMRDKPISTTFARIGSKNIVDPSLDEEKVLDGRMTMAITEKDCLCAAQKSAPGFYTKKDLDEMLDVAIAKSKENRKFVKRE